MPESMDTSQIEESADGLSYEERVDLCTAIAHPMSSEKTLVKIRKLIKRG